MEAEGGRSCGYRRLDIHPCDDGRITDAMSIDNRSGSGRETGTVFDSHSYGGRELNLSSDRIMGHALWKDISKKLQDPYELPEELSVCQKEIS